MAERNVHGQFLPGVSGNPAGRHHLAGVAVEAAVDACIGEHGEHAVAILWAMAQGRPIPIPGTVDQQGAVSYDRVPSLELQAGLLRWFYERKFGRTRQTVAVTTSAAPPLLDMTRLSDADLVALRDIVKKGAPGGTP